MVKKRSRPQPEEVEFEEVRPEEASEGRLIEWVTEHREKIAYVIGGIAVVVLGYFAYQNFVIKPKQEEAQQYFYQAERYFQADSFQQAAYGAGPVMGFIDIADEYSSTATGNAAKLYAGLSLRNLGKYEEALEYLKEFNPPTTITEIIKEGALGDVYAELKEYQEAAAHYQRAATLQDNEVFSPFYLFKAGLMNELAGNYATAVELYTQLSEKYPEAPTATNIKGYIARARARSVGAQ